ncbi:TrkH family potassium uptake protein [Paenibacillus thermoaerophilus]|uniref:TrkH family potassium uptake protein n=1 Tax=Paenibacillus thermoaerophilus TaxID=1215385 RepID=A0ABW2V866_9BACL|nr:TrkH family potassium uptake protein [Paenibacillus thermoaerophilus]TMV05752.1 Trk family potassium uptake protein [Paenibacillus thermoaerophilus]TMV18371.1 Trk family potassium uptake protein [Paenibacillus thermoaerophilus]
MSTSSRLRKFQWTPPRILVLGFAVIIWIGALLLTLPVSSSSGERLPLLDALFTATSATCVTGLVVVDTGTYFSVFGQAVLAVLIQVGGLGFMTMTTLFALLLKKRITLKERLILQEAMNQGSMEGIVRLIRKVAIYSLTIEGIGALLFAIRWSFDMEPGRAVYFGVWHAISMFNNAGFDLFGEFRSLTLYADDPVVNLVAMGLIVSGGLGFAVLSDLAEFPKRRRLSLHSKAVLSMTGFLIAVGAVVIFALEYSNGKTLGSLDVSGKFWASLFQSVTPRTAGANTIDIAGLSQATQFFIVLLMFIGASPGSTGGGIKTTTFTVLIGAMLAMIRGKEDVVLFRHRLAGERIYKAITLTMFALLLVVVMTMALSTTEDHHFLMILFEVTSAFGTVGLSMGLTPDLTDIGKILISLTMFAGRLGPVTLAYALRPKPDKELYRYPEGRITIG